jgi:RNA polymerase sigma factor (TIGR02999 family)
MRRHGAAIRPDSTGCGLPSQLYWLTGQMRWYAHRQRPSAAINMPQTLTELLNAAQAGDAEANAAAFTLIYAELKACARRQRRLGQALTLSPTALVNELFVSLQRSKFGHIISRAHFFSLAARAMRRIIVDHARRRASRKRGGEALRTSDDAAISVDGGNAEQALELDAALTALADKDPELAKVVEWHFFAGLSFVEIARELGVNERTVRRDWELARTYLKRQISVAAPQ